MACLKCGGTGITIDGEPCDCGAGGVIELPEILEMPEQYQQSLFDRSFLPNWLHPSYGLVLQEVISTVKTTLDYKKNLLICAPPNSGKTTFAFTIFRYLYTAGIPMPNLYDLNEVRKMFADSYNKSEEYELFIGAKLAVVKIPMDVPAKFVETIMSIIDIRSRHSGHTIFLFDGSKNDLMNQDKYEKLQYIDGDGNYHTVKIHSYGKKQEDLVDGAY